MWLGPEKIDQVLELPVADYFGTMSFIQFSQRRPYPLLSISSQTRTSELTRLQNQHRIMAPLLRWRPFPQPSIQNRPFSATDSSSIQFA